MKKQVIKLFDKIILLLLGIAGAFIGCEKKSDCGCEENQGFMPKYGPPAAYYGIRGTITNEANSKPIPNIRIIRKLTADYADTLYSDSNGNYDFTHLQANKENSILLKVEDIDGQANGGYFASKEVNIKFTKTEREQMKECSQKGGRFVRTQNIELKKK